MSAIDLMTQQYVEIQQLKTELVSVRAERDRADGWNEAYIKERDRTEAYLRRAEATLAAIRAFCTSARFSIIQVRDVLALLDAAPKAKGDV
jgi:hypothetical protein